VVGVLCTEKKHEPDSFLGLRLTHKSRSGVRLGWFVRSEKGMGGGEGAIGKRRGFPR
jgi:hypothetical protein